MKLRDVPSGRVFGYLEKGADKCSAEYLKLQNNKFLKPPEINSSLTELAAKIGEGKILHCNPESEVIILK